MTAFWPFYLYSVYRCQLRSLLTGVHIDECSSRRRMVRLGWTRIEWAYNFNQTVFRSWPTFFCKLHAIYCSLILWRISYNPYNLLNAVFCIILRLILSFACPSWWSAAPAAPRRCRFLIARRRQLVGPPPMPRWCLIILLGFSCFAWIRYE